MIDPSEAGGVSGPGASGGLCALDDLLDHQPMTPQFLVVAAICFLALVAEGYDLAAAALMIQPMAASFGAKAAALMDAFALQGLGLALGAVGLGPLADRFGRRPLLLACLVLFGLVTLGTVASDRLPELAVIRFVGGVLAGALTPITVSLLADMSPLKWRGSFVGFAYSGLFFGPMGASLVGGWLLEPYGWKLAFWIGGLAPLAAAPLVYAFVPESPRFLSRSEKTRLRIPAALRSLGIVLPAGAHTIVASPTPPARRIPVVDLFADRRGLLTAMLWLGAMCSLSVVTIMGLLPTFYHDLRGVPLAAFARVLSLAQIGSLVAATTAGVIMDRLGANRSLFLFACGGAAGFAGLIFVPFGGPLFAITLLAASYGLNCAQMNLNIATPTVYPPQIRAAGVGWKGGMSRVASTVAPLAAAWLLRSRLPLEVVLLIMVGLLAILALLTPLLALGVRRAADGRGR